MNTGSLSATKPFKTASKHTISFQTLGQRMYIYYGCSSPTDVNKNKLLVSIEYPHKIIYRDCVVNVCVFNT